MTQARPDISSIVWAKPTRSRHGPSSPYAGIRAITAAGLMACTAGQSSPNFSITRGVKFSTTRSAHSIRRSARASPLGSARFRVRPRLLTLMFRKKLLYSHQRSRLTKYPAAAGRIPSMRWIDSTWITSAPRAAKTRSPPGPPTSR